MTLDLEFCGALVRLGTLKGAIDAGVTAEMIEDEGARRIYQGLFQHFTTYREIPSPSAFQLLTGVSLETLEDRGPDSLGFYVDLIRARHAEQVIARGFLEAQPLLEQQETLQYIEKTSTVLRDARKLWDASLEKTTFAAMAQDHLAAYDRAKLTSGLTGIPTPWPTINDATGGVQPGDYWLIVGKRKLGKSWAMCAMAVEFARAGFKVLFVPMEMSIAATQMRMICIAGGFNPTAVRKASFHPEIEKRFRQYVEWFGQEVIGRSIVFAPRKRASTCDEIAVLEEEENPEVTMIDGVYLLDKKKYPRLSRVERLEHTSSDLRARALTRNRAVIASHQFNRVQDADEVDVDLDNVGMSDSLTFDPNVILAFSRNEELRDKNQMVQTAMKVREGEEPDPTLLNWGIQRVDFSEIGPYVPPSRSRETAGRRGRGRQDDDAVGF